MDDVSGEYSKKVHLTKKERKFHTSKHNLDQARSKMTCYRKEVGRGYNVLRSLTV